MTISSEDNIIAGFQPPVSFFKVASTVKASATPHALCLSASGYPNPLTIGVQGLSGTIVDGTIWTNGGIIPFTNPPTGQSTYLSNIGINLGTQTFSADFFDLLWYNTGIVVTNATAQTINSITLPPRDMNGATNGVGVFPWLYCQTATTNAATSITISYTNSNGVTGQTATIGLTGWPATATAGTFIPFVLQNGDVGVQSIQSITLGNTLAGGAIALMLIRDISNVIVVVSPTGITLDWAALGFPQLYNGTALSFRILPTATTIGTLFGNLVFCQG